MNFEFVFPSFESFFAEMTFDVISRVALGQNESRQFRTPDVEVTINVLQRFNNNWLVKNKKFLSLIDGNI